MSFETEKVKHVLGLSGGKDSSALAIYMRDNYPELEIEYFFTDTGEELDEVYEYLNMLEGYSRQTNKLSRSEARFQILDEPIQQFPPISSSQMVYRTTEAQPL